MEILKCIEELRDEINEMVNDFESCDREKLLELSEKMDKAILEYIKKMENSNE